MSRRQQTFETGNQFSGDAEGTPGHQFNFVVSTNEPALRLWKSLGFAVVGRLPAAPAKVTHASTGPAYPFVSVCDQVEGEGNCEQSHDQLWRPKAVAYMATLGSAPQISPRYPRLDGQGGLRRDDGALLGLDDPTIILVTLSAKRRLVEGK